MEGTAAPAPGPTHTVEVATILATLRLDWASVISGLIHDTLEDTALSLSDRLHNMRTLEHLPPDKRRRIAQETRDIYAPLAHRLGMAAILARQREMSQRAMARGGLGGVA